MFFWRGPFGGGFRCGAGLLGASRGVLLFWWRIAVVDYVVGSFVASFFVVVFASVAFVFVASSFSSVVLAGAVAPASFSASVPRHFYLSSF